MEYLLLSLVWYRWYLLFVVVSGEEKSRCAKVIRFPIGFSPRPNILCARERVSITALGVCDATAHEPCNTSGVNTLW